MSPHVLKTATLTSAARAHTRPAPSTSEFQAEINGEQLREARARVRRDVRIKESSDYDWTLLVLGKLT